MLVSLLLHIDSLQDTCPQGTAASHLGSQEAGGQSLPHEEASPLGLRLPALSGAPHISPLIKHCLSPIPPYLPHQVGAINRRLTAVFLSLVPGEPQTVHVLLWTVW